MHSTFDAKKTWDQFHKKYECSRHYVIKLKPDAKPPSEETLGSLPFAANSAYVRHQDKLYYVNKLKRPNPVIEIKASDETLNAFDAIAMPHEKARALFVNELRKIAPLIQHIPLSEERRLQWYRQRLSEEKNTTFASELKKKERMSSKELLKLLAAKEKWQEDRKKSTLAPVNLRGNHSKEFDELAHDQTFDKSIDEEKLKKLAAALKQADWNNAIFKDPHLPELAMSLFASHDGTDRISRQQLTTILERAQAFKDYEHVGTYAILNENGQFTLLALEKLLPNLGYFFFEPLTSEQLENFRQLILALPKSEQIWYAMTNSSNEFSLGENLMGRDTLLFSRSDNVLLQLSVGVQDALGLVRFKDNYVPRRHALGPATPTEIELGVRAKKRIGALSYPKTIAFKNVHNIDGVTAFEATLHDVYHSNLMSAAPKEVLEGFLYAIAAIREMTKKELRSDLSKEIWALIDCDIMFIFDKLIAKLTKSTANTLSSQEITELFADSFTHYEQGIKNLLVSKKDNGNWLSPVGAILLLDMIKHAEKWSKIKINFDPFAKNYFGSFYHIIKKMYPAIKNEEPKLQILKILLYCNFSQHTNQLLPVIFDLISKHKDYFLASLSFKKITRPIVKNKKLSETDLNLIYFSNDDDDIDFNFTKLMNDLARLNGVKEKNYADFSHGILNLNFDLTETVRYVNLRKQEISPVQAEFLVKPTLFRWAKANFKKALCVIPLLYGLYVTYQARKSNAQVIAPPASPASPAIPTIPAIIPAQFDKQSEVPTVGTPQAQVLSQPMTIQTPSSSLTDCSMFPKKSVIPTLPSSALHAGQPSTMAKTESPLKVCGA